MKFASNTNGVTGFKAEAEDIANKHDKLLIHPIFNTNNKNLQV